MYIININNHGLKFYQRTFTSEQEYNAFVEGLLFGLEMSNIRYTYNEMLCEIGCVTELTFNIL